MAIYTRNEAADILELVDDLLTAHGIRVPSEEDDQRDADNDAALYGMVYWGLLDAVESAMARVAKRAKGGEEIVERVFE